MDSLPTELVLCNQQNTLFTCLCEELIVNILNYSDTMSRLMLSMTCKRHNEIYHTCNICTSKDIQLDIRMLSGFVQFNPNKYTINIKICNTLSTIIDRVKKYVTKPITISISKYGNGFNKHIRYENGKYILSESWLKEPDSAKEVDGNTPIGFLDIWNDINFISIYCD